MVPRQPESRTGLRPTRSDRLPQNIPVSASASEKADTSIPAKKEASDPLATLKSLTITHEYGKIEVKAIGSATRHIAIVKQL